MTENEAKTKWCPFVRRDNASTSKHGLDLEPIDGHPGRVTYSVDCIGSDCMMWRTQQITERLQDLYVGDGIENGGYCGLAGKPC